MHIGRFLIVKLSISLVLMCISISVYSVRHICFYHNLYNYTGSQHGLIIILEIF